MYKLAEWAIINEKCWMIDGFLIVLFFISLIWWLIWESSKDLEDEDKPGYPYNFDDK
jgi:hypothetical protein